MPPRRAKRPSCRGKGGSSSFSFYVSVHTQLRVAARAHVPFPVIPNLLHHRNLKFPGGLLCRTLLQSIPLLVHNTHPGVMLGVWMRSLFVAGRPQGALQMDAGTLLMLTSSTAALATPQPPR